jgi:hypothetical protein
MKLNIDITIEHLAMLVAILFIIYFMMTSKEHFEQITNSNSKPKDRACAQESINYAFLDYVFGGVKSPR